MISFQRACTLGQYVRFQQFRDSSFVTRKELTRRLTATRRREGNKVVEAKKELVLAEEAFCCTPKVNNNAGFDCSHTGRSA